MKKLLQKFGEFDSVVRFDTATGSTETTVLEDKKTSTRDKGVAYREADGTWMALFEERGCLYFQFGKRSVLLSDGAIRVVYWKTFLGSVFVLHRGVTVLFRKIIGPRSKKREPFDPTYDSIDKTHSDFYAFVASTIRFARTKIE